jgi:hypothetical protein
VVRSLCIGSKSGLRPPESCSNGSNSPGNSEESEKRWASRRRFWHSVSFRPSASSVSSSTPESGREDEGAGLSSRREVTEAVFTDSVLLAIPGKRERIGVRAHNTRMESSGSLGPVSLRFESSFP